MKLECCLIANLKSFNADTIYNHSLKQIEKNNEIIELGKKESMLLELLLVNTHKITTKEKIIYHTLDLDEVTDSALKNLLSSLRAKVGKNNIINFIGQGWKILLKK